MKQYMDLRQASVIYFTETGKALAENIGEKLQTARPGLSLRMGRTPGQSLQEWCRVAFGDSRKPKSNSLFHEKVSRGFAI